MVIVMVNLFVVQFVGLCCGFVMVMYVNEVLFVMQRVINYLGWYDVVKIKYYKNCLSDLI